MARSTSGWDSFISPENKNFQNTKDLSSDWIFSFIPENFSEYRMFLQKIYFAAQKWFFQKIHLFEYRQFSPEETFSRIQKIYLRKRHFAEYRSFSQTRHSTEEARRAIHPRKWYSWRKEYSMMQLLIHVQWQCESANLFPSVSYIHLLKTWNSSICDMTNSDAVHKEIIGNWSTILWSET